ncbi:MAG: 5-formyltetrahydrofolate cyclo-ligase [Gammaproteobacteria bacterium]
MAPGVYEIPVPQGTSVVHPDAVIIPMNAFDEQGYRLGYGGGYFDRTLAALQPKPIAIGIGYEMFRVGTIHPCEHDIPMDFIVTEKGIHAMEEGRLRHIDAAACTERVTRLSAARRLPRAQPVGSAP